MRGSCSRPRLRAALPVVVFWWLGSSAPAAAQFPCPPHPSEVEPNGSLATATPLILPYEQVVLIVTGSIAVAGDEDFFRIRAREGDLLWLLADTGVAQAPGGMRDSVLDVYDGSGALLESDDDDGTAVMLGAGSIVSSDAAAVAGLRLPATGSYFVRVKAKGRSAIMNYRLLLARSRTPSQPEIEPNDQPQMANWPEPTILANTSPGDVDYYVANVLDFGVPFVIVDGAPGNPATSVDLVLQLEQPVVPPPSTLLINSSGQGARPAEAFLSPSIGMIRVTGTYSGPEPSRPYRIGVFYTTECPVPLVTDRLDR
jgi:hypothetical protein